ncbi:MAG: hypothetical protein LKJ75_10750 [Clostridia bacterium]|jgi:hypothetical protein|nr:hypothetical protein [Clostridia bacterium]MCI2015666.1 hypothetical protein [Clostridia bacterium]
MKKVLKFLDDFYPALILIALFACYEYSMFHFLINILIGIFNNTVERNESSLTFAGTIKWTIRFCIIKSFEYTLHGHIIPFIILFVQRKMAKYYPAFNKKVFIILCIVTLISLILVFCIRLYANLWGNYII